MKATLEIIAQKCKSEMFVSVFCGVNILTLEISISKFVGSYSTAPILVRAIG